MIQNPYLRTFKQEPIIVKGSIQNYDNRRKKIEIKKAIKLIYGLLDESKSSYLMEYYSELDKVIERVKEIYQKTGQLPVLLSFERKRVDENEI